MTPHIEAKKGEIAKTVIMSGDPKRAEFIAKTYLKDYRLVSDIRGMHIFTGKYKNKEITVMGHGMGMPSIGIYAHELYTFYEVENIIRVGSCGSFKNDLKLMDVVVATEAYTESTYPYLYSKSNQTLAKANIHLLKIIENAANKLSIKYKKGVILTTDVFDHYVDWQTMYKRVAKKVDVIAAEMEAFALFHIANTLNKKAACLLTVVDSHFDTRKISATEREQALTNMITIALETAKNIK